jgi:hypothetical protein
VYQLADHTIKANEIINNLNKESQQCFLHLSADQKVLKQQERRNPGLKKVDVGLLIENARTDVKTNKYRLNKLLPE